MLQINIPIEWRDVVVKKAMELYNQECYRTCSHMFTTVEEFKKNPPAVVEMYVKQAIEIVQQEEQERCRLWDRALQVAADDRKFIEENPVNGDIDLSPYPLLSV